MQRSVLVLLLPLLCGASHPYAFEKPDPSVFSRSSFLKRQGAPVQEQSRSQGVEDQSEGASSLRVRNLNERPSLNATFAGPSLAVPAPSRKSVVMRKKVEDYYDDYYAYDDYMFRKPKPVEKTVRRSGLAPQRRRGMYKAKKGEAALKEDDYYDDYYYGAPEQPEPSRRQGIERDGGGGHHGGGGGGYGKGGGGGLNPLALLVAPLAAISLLSAAAAVALNPVLVSISVTGRKKRDANDVNTSGYLTPAMEEKLEEMKVLEQFLGKMPEQRDESYQKKLLSMYLSCSGFTASDNKCLDRVVCQYSEPNSLLEKEDRDVISIILYHIMGNEEIEEAFKDRLRNAAQIGRADISGHNCQAHYPCSQLDFTN